MTEIFAPPPEELTGAKVLAYAVVDNFTPYTGAVTTYVDGELLGPVPLLAVASNNYEPGDYLLLLCGEQWQVLAASGHHSAEEAMAVAGRMYAGVGSRWQHVA